MKHIKLITVILLILFSLISKGEDRIGVLQINVWQEGTCVPGGFDALVDNIIESGADVVFMQEIRNYGGRRFIPRLIEALALRGVTFYGEDTTCDSGVISRFPLAQDGRKWEGCGSVQRVRINAGGHPVALYAAHLDYTNYACYYPRGYDGNTWKKIPAPETSVEKILEMNRASGRDDTIRDFIRLSRADIDEGIDVILAGDFNEPSHLDWTAQTASLWDHNGAVIPWDCSTMLYEGGFEDSFRVVNPDPVSSPGFTFPSDNSDCNPMKLTWASESDERDRIDFIYYYGEGALKPVDSKVFGPAGSIVRGKRTVEENPSDIIPVTGKWPTDHKAVLTTFEFAPVARIFTPSIPTIVDREHNIICEICLESFSGKDVLESVGVTVSGIDPSAIRNARLMYTGTSSAIYSRTTSYILKDQFRRIGAGQDTWRHPAFAVQTASCKAGKDGRIVLKPGKSLVRDRNYFYLSLEVDSRKVDLSGTFGVAVESVELRCPVQDGSGSLLRQARIVSEGSLEGHRFGIALRNHKDDNVFSYRIPGLVTTPKGTLIAVYDIRHTSGNDLQDNIDVGASRSTDGGRTWEKMRTIIDMGEWGGLPQGQNGCGDPSVLVDSNTGTIFVCALWTHGLGNRHAFSFASEGYEPISTGQMVLVKSTDDGKTWSKPVNITRQVKRPDWRLTLQGPGRGITMQDGTLVFPMQCLDSKGIPSSGIMYSKDGGETWHCHSRACDRTTEAQVAEIAPGVLMLNCRNDRRQGRVVCVTDDLGKTWKTHPSSGSLVEPVCMAGLLNIPASENIYGRDILLFSNPVSSPGKGRNHICIKASLDAGMTWNPLDCLLLDQEEGWGYSCLTSIGNDKVGILYEGSTSHLVFQQVRLSDIVKSIPAPSGLSVGEIYSDDMIFQRDVPLEISGRTALGLEVKVTLGPSTRKCRSAQDGTWKVRMPALKAGTGIPFTVTDGRDTLSFSNVAAGEVWLCSGQSNMAFELKGADTFSKEGLDDPMLRFYDMKSHLKTWGLVWSEEDAGKVAQGKYYDRTRWNCSSEKTAGEFSAVGYYFGKMLRDSLNVPVGLICNAVGGTTTESFISRSALEKVLPGFCDGWLEDESVMEWARGRARENMSAFKGGYIQHPFMPAYLFENGIRPLERFPIKGAIWYQGESNAENIPQHEILFRTLVDCWRQTWDNPDLPFYFVQLSSIERPTWPEFRNSQRLLSLEIPHCGMAVSSDLGHPTDVHPRAKKPVGERLARLALKNDYGKQVECLAPAATKAYVNDSGNVTVLFDRPISVPGTMPVRGFRICLEDGSEIPASAEISGSDAVILSRDAGRPDAAADSKNTKAGSRTAIVKVKYAWDPWTDANLTGTTGLPVSTFDIEIGE